jgi:arylsulfatase A-like enzyme
MLTGRDPRLTAETCRRILANYGGKIALVDHWVGRILDTLAARGLSDDTLVVFWSDVWPLAPAIHGYGGVADRAARRRLQ